MDATGKYAYVTNWASNTVSQYVIDASGASPRWQRRPSTREFDPLQLQPGTRRRTDSHRLIRRRESAGNEAVMVAAAGHAAPDGA